MKQLHKALIVGGNSVIAKHLVEQLTIQSAIPEYYVTQRQDIDAQWYLDLSNKASIDALLNTINLEKITMVVVLAAVTSNAACLENKAYSKQVNVTNTQYLLQQLTARSVFSVYLSSSQVFDHQNAKIAFDHTYCPTTLYGKQKVSVERFIQQHKLNVAIVRMTKVIGAYFPLFEQVIDGAKTNQKTSLFNDYCAAPITINFACDALIQIMLSKKTGVYQLSGAEDLSYYDMAKRLVKQLSLTANIIGVSSATKNITPCLYGSLLPYCPSELNFKAQPFSEVIDDYLFASLANSAIGCAEKTVKNNDGE